MRNSFLSSIGVVALLAGCSTASPGPEPFAPGAANSRLPAGSLRGAMHAAKYAGLKHLYVADYGRGTIVLLKNKTYEPDGTITTGINGPFDVTLDFAGNLYVANIGGDNVAEYAPGASQPSFVYNAGMSAPVTMTVDRQGHMFEADGALHNGVSAVNEYDQNSNVVLHACTISGDLQGVAVRENGDVFVSYNLDHQGGRIAEYKGGLSGCSATALPVRTAYPGSLVFDNAHNIIVPDQIEGRIDIVAPPYTKVTRRLGGTHFSDPYHVSINKANTLVLMTNFQKGVAFAIDYATGRIVQKLDYKQGLGVASGAVSGENAVH